MKLSCVARRLAALSLSVTVSLHGPPLAWPATTPYTSQEIASIQQAFRDFDAKRLPAAEAGFDRAVGTARERERPRDEVVGLLMARGNARVDLKRFPEALGDYDEALRLMEVDAMKTESDGRTTARYREYPNAFVQRGLAREGLGDWEGAAADYSSAISLWGGGRGEGINPYALVYRGNALAQLGRYREAVPDYEAAADRFLGLKDKRTASEARANLALALYEAGDTDEAVRTMKALVRKGGMDDERVADMHMALAAAYAAQGDAIAADAEYNAACYDTRGGCARYKDSDWLLRIRRWPPSLVRAAAEVGRR